MTWLLLAFLGGCDDTEFPSHVPDGPSSDGFEGVVEIFDANCVGCHGAGGSFPDLQTDPCATLVDQPSQAYSGVLVTPGDSELSVLWHKMENTGDFGGIMPSGATEPLPADTLAVLTDWIDGGAQCSEGGTDPDPDPGPDTGTDIETFYSDVYPLISGQCAGCHDEDGAGGLSLNEESSSYITLSTDQSSTGQPYVKLSEPTNSYLYMKITGSAGIDGNAMPPDDGVAAADAATVLTWIEQGARQ
jgi:mono/diheme cytochrome c family protein